MLCSLGIKHGTSCWKCLNLFAFWLPILCSQPFWLGGGWSALCKITRCVRYTSALPLAFLHGVSKIDLALSDIRDSVAILWSSYTLCQISVVLWVLCYSLCLWSALKAPAVFIPKPLFGGDCPGDNWQYLLPLPSPPAQGVSILLF